MISAYKYQENTSQQATTSGYIVFGLGDDAY